MMNACNLVLQRRSRWTAGGLVAAAMLLGAGAVRADGNTPAACDRLPAADVQAVFGAGYAKSPFSLGKDTCVYQKGSDMVALMTAPAPDGADTLLVERRRTFTGKATPAAEVGPAAFFISAGKSTALHFGKGRWVGQLEGTVGGRSDPQKLLQLARRILARG